MIEKIRWDILVGITFVALLHGVVLYGLWHYKLIPAPNEAVTLFVNLISPPPPKVEPQQPKPPKLPREKVKLEKPHPVERPKPVPILTTKAPVESPSEPVAPPPEPVVEPPPAPSTVVEAPPQPPAPIRLSSELSVACPHNSPPDYPAMSRRLNEEGKVVLRVELDESGHISSARVSESSGHKRLDEAGLQAVRRWQCNPAMRNGVAVRAVAFQPFDFILEGR